MIDLTERREMLAELESVEREMKTERWSSRQEEASLLVAFRGGDDEYSIMYEPQLVNALILEVVVLLSGKPIDAFFIDTARRPWRVTIKDRAPKMAGKIEATALGRGLLRVLPNICRSTYLYVEGSVAKR